MHWRPPTLSPSGVVKVNTDAAIFAVGRAFGVGIVIRDSQGRFVAAKSQKLNGDADAYRAKIIAVKEGLLLFA